MNWCFDCGSALAEAEVEYEDRKDPAIDVGFPFGDVHKVARAFGLQRLDDKPGFAVIWTTTPWTIPANQALNVHPEHIYNLVDTPRGYLVLAADLQEACLARFGLTGTTVASVKGAALEGLPFRHPFYDRLSPVYLGDYVTLDTGTGIVHSAPAYGVEDFESCRRYGMHDDDMLNPVQADGRYAASLPFFGGLSIWDANPKIVAKLREVGALFHEAAVRAQLHALLAAQDAGDPPRDDAVVRGHGRGAGVRRPEAAGDAARNRAARRRGDASSSPAGARRGCTA